MINPMRLLLSRYRKRPKGMHKTSGFTLLELLVAMILAVLVITPLLGYMIDILSTDHKEQAKASTEQDIQAALDYIAQDLEQAVYIYDGKGIKAIQSQLPSYGTPALVFWKRSLLPKTIPQNVTNLNNPGCAVGTATCNDTFVFSIVAYYLVKPDTSTPPVWSNQAVRIARLEMKDGIKNPAFPTQADGKTPNYLTAPAPQRDPGFQLFDLSSSNTGGSTLDLKMNSWKSVTGETPPAANVLVDYVDQTTGASAPAQVNCRNVLGLPATDTRTEQDIKTTGPSLTNAGPYTSFYACVDTINTVAQVYVRGNALARIQQSGATYTQDSPYFPIATIQIKGRGFLLVQ